MLDYEDETQRTIELRVTVRDNDETHTDTASIKLYVSNIADKPPVFQNPNPEELELRERDAKKGQQIENFIAVAQDSPPYHEF